MTHGTAPATQPPTAVPSPHRPAKLGHAPTTAAAQHRPPPVPITTTTTATTTTPVMTTTYLNIPFMPVPTPIQVPARPTVAS